LSGLTQGSCPVPMTTEVDPQFRQEFSTARPRAMAALARYFQSVDLAEDAFQEACVRALKSWPKQMPDDPISWLVLVGRNAGIDALRRQNRERQIRETPDAHEVNFDVEDAYAENLDMSDFRDDVLRLLFMCCHEELQPQDQLALALKVVAGFSVLEISRAFLVKPKTMEQRITRAKKKAASVVAALETPSPLERTERLSAVLTMLYLLFNEGYLSGGGGDVHIKTALCEEAIRLTRLLLVLFPSQPEVMGLLALCLLHSARVEARQTSTGSLISLEDQDRSLWDQPRISEGQSLVDKALRIGKPGIFQIQAAIASVHCMAQKAKETDWEEIVRLYDAFLLLQPSAVVKLNRLVAVSKVLGTEVALAELGELGPELDGYLYYHTTAAAFFEDVGQPEKARSSYKKALTLMPTGAEAVHIRGRLSALEN
jgi:RNA polymerase sigma-70 factor, ECF subfamily